MPVGWFLSQASVKFENVECRCQVSKEAPIFVRLNPRELLNIQAILCQASVVYRSLTRRTKEAWHEDDNYETILLHRLCVHGLGREAKYRSKGSAWRIV